MIDKDEYINSVILSDNKKEQPIKILLHINKNHYQLLYFKDFDEDIKIIEKKYYKSYQNC